MQKVLQIALPSLLMALVGCAGGSPEPQPISPSLPTSTPSVSSLEVAPVSPSPATAPPTVDGDLWAQLQQPTAPYFVLIRHTLAPGTGDPANFVLEDCTTQRNLSAEGRSQAVRTGDAFKQRDIEVDRVLSSQWCRCLDTAELMDIGPVEPFPPLNSFFRDRAAGPEQTAQVQAFMAEQQGTPGVTVMVTHFVNISALSDAGVASGELVVLRLNDQQQLEVLGQIDPL